MPALDGHVGGSLRLWLRAEGAATFAGCCLLYTLTGQSWLLFALLFFVPDVSFAAYWAGPRIGAVAYNVLHFYGCAWALAGLGWWLGSPAALGVAIIWAAHVGFDRMAGYGLKDPSGFHFTHLGPIGPAARQANAG